MLYPIQNKIRNRMDLPGIWDFQVDPKETGQENGWFNRLPKAIPIAVPGSWNEQYAEFYNYLGMAWYLTTFFIPKGWQGQRVFLRVGSANYFARVWINGVIVGEHEGGHLPFAFDITEKLKWSASNTIAILVENHLTPTRVPPGNTGDGFGGINAGYPDTTFDFFPYAGLHRPVLLYTVPKNHIEDITVVPDIKGSTGRIDVKIEVQGNIERGRVILSGENGEIDKFFTTKSGSGGVSLKIPQARFWSPEDPYLYRVTIELLDKQQIVDSYTMRTGIRTIAVEGDQILLNGKSIFLRGCARHEDFYVHGKGLNLPLLVKDYDLMKWIGANSYRTSHYPYSEEEMQMADRCGMLIIDEIPAVGLFFDDNHENVQRRLEQCKQQLRELISRDKNHPSVIMWSIANEPVPPKMIERLMGGDRADQEPGFASFFDVLYRLARELDPSRLVTLVGLMGGPLEWQTPSDVICLNRYWGWYTQPGQMALGAELLGQELDSIYETIGKPIILSEFGADTVAGMHSHPPKMWTEEYQVEMIRAYLDAADEREFVVGTHVWNFADFQAVQSIRRAEGMNYKGVFTRDRKPKMAAHFLRERWLGETFGSKKTERINQDQGSEINIETNAQAMIKNHLSQLVSRLDGKRLGVTKTLEFDLMGGGIYRIVMIDGATRLEIGKGESEARMVVSLEDAIKIFSGKLNPMVAVMTGKVKLSGDVMAFQILQDLG